MVDEEYTIFVDRAHMVLQYLRDLKHDLSPQGEYSEDEMLPRVGSLFGLTNGLMSATFYQEFTSYLTHDGALDRFYYTDLSLNSPVSLDQPITRLTQSLVNEGGLVDPRGYHFFLMKIRALYETTCDMDESRLQKSHTYRDVSQYFHMYRTTMCNILHSATLAAPWSRAQVHFEIEKLVDNFNLLLENC